MVRKGIPIIYVLALLILVLIASYTQPKPSHIPVVAKDTPEATATVESSLTIKASPSVTPTLTVAKTPIPTSTERYASPAPPATETPLSSSTPIAGFIYTVRWGDTLFSIARRFGTTVEAIARANGIVNSRLILVGQKLIIPAESTAAPSLERTVDEIIAEMTLKEKIGQMLMVGFEGTTANEQVKKLLYNYHVGGIILLSRNIQSPTQVAQLTKQLQKMAMETRMHIPLLISIDHEGGSIVRFTGGVTFFPSNMALGAAGSADYAYQEGQIVGKELQAMGINMNLAPVLDVNDNPANPVIGLRSYGESSELVASLGVAYIKGLQEEGVMATAKHFPGHGNTIINSHTDLPTVNKDRSALEQVEFYPFRKAIAAGVAAIMTGHISVPAIDPTPRTPATLSSKIISGLLRGEMGYNGLILSDSMDMGAITKYYGVRESAIRAVEAGVDMLLVPWSFEMQADMYDALLRAVKDGRITEERIDGSVRRILLAKRQYAVLPAGQIELVGIPEHQALATEISDMAVTLVKDEKGVIPLRLVPDQQILVISPSLLPLSEQGTIFGDYIRARHRLSSEVVIDIYDDSTRDAAAAQALKQAQEACVIIVGTWYAGPWQETLVKNLLAIGKTLIVIAFGGPYDLMHFPQIETYLVTYGILPSQIEAVVKVIFGEIPPQGQLPVSIPGLTSQGQAASK